ncbi:MAG: hypothetical protein WDZ30_09935, partial [Cellvibrionaceae bacterium]
MNVTLGSLTAPAEQARKREAGKKNGKKKKLTPKACWIIQRAFLCQISGNREQGTRAQLRAWSSHLAFPALRGWAGTVSAFNGAIHGPVPLLSCTYSL